MNTTCNQQCDICHKIFDKKQPYNRHLKRKTPCKINKINIIEKSKFELLNNSNYINNNINNINNINNNIDFIKNFDKLLILNMSHIKPVLKWAGGKGQILDKLFYKFPTEIKNYYEPFIGGGSVFLEFLKQLEEDKIKISGKIILNDFNTDLINLYNTIKNNHDKLLCQLNDLKSNYNKSPLIHQVPRYKFIYTVNDTIDNVIPKGKSYVYYYYRKEYNEIDISKGDNSIRKSALLLFLNKTCFRGLYRTGKNGFNVPYGNTPNASIYSVGQINTLNTLFNKYDIIFHNTDFKESLKDIELGDFVYMDPPYHPMDTGKSFVSYNSDDFKNGHKELVVLCKDLKEKNIKFLHSNSFCKFNTEHYRDNGFKTETISCRRRINSKKPQDTDLEYLIYN